MAAISLEILQSMLQRLLDDSAALRSDSRELKDMLGMLENHVASLTSNEAEHYASLSARLDHVGNRLGRIERRLEDTASGR